MSFCTEKENKRKVSECTDKHQVYAGKRGTPSEQANSCVLLFVVVKDSLSSCTVIFMCLRTLANNRYCYVMSVRPSARMSAAPTGRLKVKFDIEVFYGKPSRTSNLSNNGKKRLSTLHEDIT